MKRSALSAALSTRSKLVIFVASLVTVMLGAIAYISARIDDSFIERQAAISTQAAFDSLAALQANALFDGNLTEIRKILALLRADPNIERAVVADTAGRVLSDGTEENARFFRLLDTELLAHLQNAPGLVTASQRRGEAYEAIMRIGIPDGPDLGYLYLRTSLLPYIALKENRLAWMFRAAIGIGILGSVAAFAFALWLTRPIHDVTRVAKQLAGGDLTARLQVRGNDEIGFLGQVMNDLAENLGGKITALESAESHLRRAKDEADTANRAKTEFLATVTHELRTPLNAIIGFADVLQADLAKLESDGAMPQYAKAIHESGEYLLKVINDILDISRVEMGKLELREEPSDLATIIDTAQRMLRTRATDAGIQVTSEIAANLPHVYCDRRKMLQVLTNVFGNAIKFTPAGGRVDIRAFLDLAGRPTITVTDTGIGIAPDDIEKVLSPFGQVAGALTRTHDGVGLGLPLSKALMEAQSGTLAITSEVGVSTQVAITLPRTRLILASA